jgi:hypothetical protein
MKKQIFTIALCLWASFFASAQTVRRVTKSSNVTGINIYSTIQAAHDAATAGDIIYLEPLASGTYGALICVKQLTIIGNGFSERNNNYLTTPNTPQDSKMATIDKFEMNDGSQNSKLMGVFVNGAVSYIRVPNITIDRCVMFGPYSPTIEFSTTNTATNNVGRNATITRCYLGAYIGPPNNNFNGLGSNCIITNNFFYTGGGGAAGFNNSTIANNIFGGNANVNAAFSTVYNNIFYNGSTAVIDYNGGTSNSNTISNNLCTSASGLPTGNGNINGATLSTIFVTANPSSTTPDSELQLKVGSPAIGSGIGGANMGIFAGANPFILSGLSPIPIITNYTTSGAGNSTTPLNVSVTVRGNN